MKTLFKLATLLVVLVGCKMRTPLTNYPDNAFLVSTKAHQIRVIKNEAPVLILVYYLIEDEDSVSGPPSMNIVSTKDSITIQTEDYGEGKKEIIQD